MAVARQPKNRWITAAAGSRWRISYLLAVIGLWALFYGPLGVLPALSPGVAKTARGRIGQILLVPLAIGTDPR